MRYVLLALCATLATSTSAAVSPTPGAEDPRIRTVDYHPDQVVRLKGFTGYQLMVEFSDDERIENVAVGDAALWQVTPNRRANLLFIKPLSTSGSTNMTVVTDQRRYAFELVPALGDASAPDLAYIVRFRFAAAGPKGPTQSAQAKPLNSSYALKGPPAVLPEEVFDDGQFTYFRWPAGVDVPALFIVGAEGEESVANYGVRDGYVVVETTAPSFRARLGESVATVTNRAWPEAAGASLGRRR